MLMYSLFIILLNLFWFLWIVSYRSASTPYLKYSTLYKNPICSSISSQNGWKYFQNAHSITSSVKQIQTACVLQVKIPFHTFWCCKNLDLTSYFEEVSQSFFAISFWELSLFNRGMKFLWSTNALSMLSIGTGYVCLTSFIGVLWANTIHFIKFWNPFTA